MLLCIDFVLLNTCPRHKNIIYHE